MSPQQDTASSSFFGFHLEDVYGLNHVQAYSFRSNCAKSNDGFQNGSYRPYQSFNGAGKDFNQNKWQEARTKKEKAMKAFILNPDLIH